MVKTVPAVFAGLLWLVVTPFIAWSADAPQKPYVVLDSSLSQLREDFNANAGKVRMIYIVGPTCGVCLRGLSDLQEAIYAKKNDDPRLVTFVVHVPLWVRAKRTLRRHPDSSATRIRRIIGRRRGSPASSCNKPWARKYICGTFGRFTTLKPSGRTNIRCQCPTSGSTSYPAACRATGF
jgi:hypothetical protein